MKTPDPGDAIKFSSRTLHNEIRAVAESAPRGRTNFNFHPDLQDNPHRFLNVMCRGTYITPHRHSSPPKAETFLILEGECVFFSFDDDGRIQQAVGLKALADGGDVYGVDIAPGIWHTLVPVSKTVVCFEVKPGPYVVSSDKGFAPWAPREGDVECAAYQESLLKHWRAQLKSR